MRIARTLADVAKLGGLQDAFDWGLRALSRDPVAAGKRMHPGTRV